MALPILTYFDLPISRGEECRLALHIAGVDFRDNRLKREEWLALKPTSPYGSMPIFELPGRPPLAHSNAILTYVGREHGLHPSDSFEAARHEGMMNHVEDMRAKISPTARMSDEGERKRAREQLAAVDLPAWGGYAEKNITGAPFFAGEKLSVVDIKLHIFVRWIVSGTLDHIPTNVFDNFPKLLAISSAVEQHPGVLSWRSRQQ